MKYIIDIPNEMVIKSALNGLTLGIAMIETSTQKQFIVPTNIPLMPYIEPQKWIPVSERLPKDKQEILFSTKTGRVHSGRYHDDNSVNQWYSHKDRARAWNNVVIAWMPLPESYKEEEE